MTDLQLTSIEERARYDVALTRHLATSPVVHVPSFQAGWDERGADVERLERERDALREALGGLVARLDEIHGDSRFQSVWMMAEVHGNPYTGPTYENELNAARAALEARDA